MKYITPLIIILLAACSGHQKKIQTPTTNLKIKSCKVYTADFGLLDDSSPGLLIQEFKFNKEGYVRELIRFDNEGNITGTFEIDGSESPFPLPDKPEFMDTTITNEEFGTMGNLRKKEIKKYNSNGLITEVQLYNPDDSLKQKNTYEYNPEGFVSKDIYWDVELNTPIQVINYVYEFYPE